MIINSIGSVSNNINSPVDDNWSDVISIITLNDDVPASSTAGLEEFSHIEVVFYFDKVNDSKICYDKRRPRNNPDWPEIGIFSQRGKNRPNKIGVTICELLKIEDNKLTVKGLDAINGTPVIDIKPVFKEFLPKEIIQPGWVSELMRNYW